MASAAASAGPSKATSGCACQCLLCAAPQVSLSACVVPDCASHCPHHMWLPICVLTVLPSTLLLHHSATPACTQRTAWYHVTTQHTSAAQPSTTLLPQHSLLGSCPPGSLEWQRQPIVVVVPPSDPLQMSSSGPSSQTAARNHSIRLCEQSRQEANRHARWLANPVSALAQSTLQRPLYSCLLLTSLLSLCSLVDCTLLTVRSL